MNTLFNIQSRENNIVKIYEALCKQDMTIKDLMLIVDISDWTIRRVLKDLHKSGHVIEYTKMAATENENERMRNFFKVTKVPYVPKTLSQMKAEFERSKNPVSQRDSKFGIGEFFNPWVSKPDFAVKQIKSIKTHKPADYLDYSYQRIKIEPNRGIASSFNVI